MRFCFVSAILGSIAMPVLSLTLQIPSHVDHVIHEKKDTTQKKWVEGNGLDPDHVLPVRIGLKQSNLHLGMGYLMEM